MRTHTSFPRRSRGTRLGRWMAPLLLSGTFWLSTPAQAEITGNECEVKTGDRPSVGLVLGGGGARGSAHIGVIKRLEELKVPVDCVVGTSMGALVGALYSTGMDAEEMEQVVGGIAWEEVFSDQSPRESQPYRRKRDDDFGLFGPKIGVGSEGSAVRFGALSGRRVSVLLNELVSAHTTTGDFSELARPFKAVAADLATGERVVIDEGCIAIAMRASMSVPGAFDPVQYQGRLLVDGGIVDNVPVQLAKDMGADVVIAVSVGAGLLPQEDLKNLLSVAGQLVNLLFGSNVQASLDALDPERDVLIKPPIPKEITSASFASAAGAIAAGYEGASDPALGLAQLGLSDTAYAAHIQAHQSQAGAPLIQFVDVDNQSRFSDDVLRERLNVPIGQPLDIVALEQDMERIYGLGFLQQVGYEIVTRDDGETGLVVSVRQDDRGTRFIEWGLDLSSDSINEGFNARVGYLMTDIDELGSELRFVGQIGRDPAALIDLYKYIDKRSKNFITAQAFAENTSFTFFEDGTARSVFDVASYGGTLGIGREFNRHSALGGGFRAYNGYFDTQIGTDSDKVEFKARELVLNYTLDRLDDRYIPTNGVLIQSTLIHSSDSLGADEDYDQFGLTGLAARTFGGRHTLFGGLQLAATLDGDAAVYSAPRGGGLFRLSGFYDDEIGGNNFSVATLSYQYLLRRAIRVGGSIEYGGVADDTSDLFGSSSVVHGSLFLNARTPVGPAYIGAGFGEGGRTRYFIRFGNIFGRLSAVR